MCEVAGKGRLKQRSSPHNVVAYKCHQHRMLDVMIKCVAIPNGMSSVKLASVDPNLRFMCSAR